MVVGKKLGKSIKKVLRARALSKNDCLLSNKVNKTQTTLFGSRVLFEVHLSIVRVTRFGPSIGILLFQTGDVKA